MHMYHHLSSLFPCIPHKPRITKKRRFRKREIVVNNSIRMQSKHLLPLLIFLYQGRNTMPSSLIQILLTQFKMQVVLLPVITDNKLRNRRNSTHILLRIERRRSYNPQIRNYAPNMIQKRKESASLVKRGHSASNVTIKTYKCPLPHHAT